IIIFPSGFVSSVSDNRVIRKNFYSDYAQKETNEKVSVVSKGTVRYYVQAALEELFRFRKLPFVNLWHFPNGAENVFLFRIDTDFGKREQVDNLYKVIEKNNIKASWFLEVKSCEDWLSRYKEFQNQELSLHCYTHKVFNSYKNNFREISKGLEVLKSSGIFPKGFAAPYGEWNYSLAKSINDLSFEYSSEFGYAYDCYPFRPVLKTGDSKILQIPIHPVSMGRLHWGGHSEENILNYFYNLTEQKIKAQEPVALYTHPFEERFNLLDLIFKKIKSYGIPNYTFAEFGSWWNKREEFVWNAEYKDELKLFSRQPDSSVWFRTVSPEGDIFLTPSDRVQEINYKKINHPSLKLNMKISPAQLRKTTLRMRWHDYLSFYRKMKQ
ncbi:MAG: polysaccharide deacetylase family protein, partial [Ignavibacteriaceae bacterium]